MMPSTAAAPDMSSFMRSMPSALLRSSPPGVEGDALADDGDAPGGPARRPVRDSG